MADRYWVGGTGQWDATAGTKWTTASGGPGGASAPTTSDRVLIDVNSGSGTVTVAAGAACSGLTTATFPGTLAGSASLSGMSGDVTLSSSMTMAYTGTLNWTSGTPTLLTLVPVGALSASGINLTLSRDTTVTGAITISGACDFKPGGLTHSCASYAQTGTGNLQLDNGPIITITGSGGFSISGTNTVSLHTPNTSLIKLTAPTATASFAGKTYDNVEVALASNGTVTFSGANTFKDFAVTGTAGVNTTVQLPASTTMTVTSMTVTGFSPSNRLTLTSDTGAAAATISKSSGTVAVDSANISWSTATGGATFTATNAVNGGNNSGWSFTGTALFLADL
jgi:hypothetical protein